MLDENKKDLGVRVFRSVWGTSRTRLFVMASDGSSDFLVTGP